MKRFAFAIWCSLAAIASADTIIERATPSPVNTTVVTNPTAAKIQKAIDNASPYDRIELRGTGTFELDSDILIEKPIYLYQPAGMTLRLPDGWAPDDGQTGATADGITPHMSGIFVIKAGGDDTVLELHGTLDPNFDNTFQEDFPSAGIDLYPEAIWINNADRVKVTGRGTIINARVGFSVIDSDNLIIEGLHYHTPATINVTNQTAGFGAEGAYELTVRDCTISGAYEGFDLNNWNRNTVIERCTFSGHATDAGSRLEANAQAGLTIRNCRLVNMRPVEYEGAGTSQPRFSQRSAIHDLRTESTMLIDGLAVVITQNMNDPLFYFERQALDQVVFRNVMVNMTTAQSGAIVHIEDSLLSGDNARNCHFALQVYAPTVTLTQPVIYAESTCDTCTFDVDANIDGSSAQLINIQKPRNCKVRGMLEADSYSASTVMNFNTPFGRNVVDFNVRLVDSNSTAVMVNVSDTSSPGFVEVKGNWELQRTTFYALRSLVDGADTTLYSDEAFSDLIRYRSPAFWARDGITDAITGAARTQTGTVSQAQPGGVLCYPARGVTFGDATSYHHFGNVGDVGSGNFTILVMVGGVTSLSGEDGLGAISKGIAGSNARYELYLRDLNLDGYRGCFGCAVHNGTSSASITQSNDTYAITDGKMHLVMMRRNGGTLSLGQDGTVILNSATDITGWNLTNTEQLYVGCRSSDADAQINEWGTLGTSAWISQPIVINGYAMTSAEFAQLWRTLQGLNHF